MRYVNQHFFFGMSGGGGGTLTPRPKKDHLGQYPKAGPETKSRGRYDRPEKIQLHVNSTTLAIDSRKNIKIR